MNIALLLEKQAIANPNNTAIIEGQQQLTSFAELAHRIKQGAAFLQQFNLQKGDAVLVFCPMSAELYIILGALWRLGLLALFIDPNAPPEQFLDCYQLCLPKAMIAPSFAYALLGKIPSLRKIQCKITLDYPLPTLKIWWTHRYFQADNILIDCDENYPALVTFTSGSTGKPKAAVRTHGFLSTQYQILAQHLQPQATQIELTTLPIFALINLAAGRTTLIPQGNLRRPEAIAPRPIIQQIQTHQPHSLLAPPAFLERLIDYCQAHKIHLNSLKSILSGGAPIMPRLLANLAILAPNAELKVVYGSTEAEPITILPHANQADLNPEARGLCVGFKIPEIQVKILPRKNTAQSITPQAFEQICLAPDHIGEIIVAGRHVLNAYWQGTDDHHNKIQVGDTIWHRTGDAGYFDGGDRLWLVGRCAACLNENETELYPFILEKKLQQHPKIHRAAAISHQGKKIVLIETMQGKSTPNIAELKALLPSYVDIYFVKKIPVDRRHNSKILHHQLRINQI